MLKTGKVFRKKIKKINKRHQVVKSVVLTTDLNTEAIVRSSL